MRTALPGAGEQKRRRLVEDDQHRLEPSQDPIAAPVLRQLDGRSLQVPAVLLELRFEAGEKCERIGGGAGKTSQNPVVVEAPDLARALLHDGLTKGDLAVASEHGAVLVPDGQNRRAVQHWGEPRTRGPNPTLTPSNRGVKKTGRGCIRPGTAALNLGARALK